MLGPLAALVTATTRDICIDGRGLAWVDNGKGFESSDIVLSPRDVRHIGVDLIERGGGRVDDARPVGDAALPGRMRAHLALPPIARDGPLLSIRFPSARTLDLTDFDIDTESRRELLSGNSVLVAGITGSGKTTVVSALAGSRPATERIVIIEDITELDPRHGHVASLTTRAANPDGGGEVTLGQLVVEALRMRPDMLIVGEIRGPEIRDFLLALTAGHRGLATVHASSLEAVPARMTTLALLAGIPHAAVATLIAQAVDVVALCERTDEGFRVTTARLVDDDGALRIDRS